MKIKAVLETAIRYCSTNKGELVVQLRGTYQIASTVAHLGPSMAEELALSWGKEQMIILNKWEIKRASIFWSRSTSNFNSTPGDRRSLPVSANPQTPRLSLPVRCRCWADEIEVLIKRQRKQLASFVKYICIRKLKLFVKIANKCFALTASWNRTTKVTKWYPLKSVLNKKKNFIFKRPRIHNCFNLS